MILNAERNWSPPETREVMLRGEPFFCANSPVGVKQQLSEAAPRVLKKSKDDCTGQLDRQFNLSMNIVALKP